MHGGENHRQRPNELVQALRPSAAASLDEPHGQQQAAHD
jgi:hypothetical protein